MGFCAEVRRGSQGMGLGRGVVVEVAGEVEGLGVWGLGW